MITTTQNVRYAAGFVCSLILCFHAVAADAASVDSVREIGDPEKDAILLRLHAFEPTRATVRWPAWPNAIQIDQSCEALPIDDAATIAAELGLTVVDSKDVTAGPVNRDVYTILVRERNAQGSWDQVRTTTHIIEQEVDITWHGEVDRSTPGVYTITATLTELSPILATRTGELLTRDE